MNNSQAAAKSFLWITFAILISLALPESGESSEVRFHFGRDAVGPFPGLQGLMLSDDQVQQLLVASKQANLEVNDRTLNLVINTQTKNQIDITSGANYGGVHSLEIDDVELSSYKFLHDLPSLRTAFVLYKYGGKVNQQLLEALSTCKSLTTLTVMGANPSVDFSVLRRLPQLHRLKLELGEITQSMIDQISQIGSLRALELSNPKINAVLNLNFSKLKSLNELRLGGSATSVPDYATIKGLTKLEVLEFRGPLAPPKISIITSLPNLRLLTLVGSVNDDQVRSFASLSKLEGLDLVSSDFSGKSLEAFRESKLAYLILTYSNLSQEAFSHIAKIRSLKGLDLSSTPATDENIAAFVDLPLLRRLVLYNMTSATPYGAFVVSQANPQILIDGYSELADEASWDSHSPLWGSSASIKATQMIDKTAMVGPFSEREQKLLDVLALSESAGDDICVLECHKRLAALYRECAMYEQAINHCEKALQALPLIRTRLVEAFHKNATRSDSDVAPTCRQYEAQARLCLSECLRKTRKVNESDSILIDLEPVEVRGCSFQRIKEALFYDCAVAIRHKLNSAVRRRQRLLAFTDYEKIADRSQDSICVHQQLAKQYLMAGDLLNAEKDQEEAYRLATAKYPRSPLPQLCKVIKASILIQKKQYAEAEQILRAMMLKPDEFDSLPVSPYEYADICDQYEALLRDTARPVEASAVEEMAKTIRLNPPQPRLF